MSKSNRGKTIAVIRVPKIKGRNLFTFHPKMLLRHQTEEFVDECDKRSQNKELKEIEDQMADMLEDIDEDNEEN